MEAVVGLELYGGAHGGRRGTGQKPRSPDGVGLM